MDQPVLAAARFVSYGALLLTAGLPFHALIDRRPWMRPAERRVLAAIAALAMAASLGWALASVAAMAGLAPSALDRATFSAVIAATPLGHVLWIRGTALAAFLLALRIIPRSALLTMLGLVALTSTAFTGHAGAGEGARGIALIIGDGVHLAAAALWLGAMFGFLSDALGAHPIAQRLASLRRFATTGSLIVAALFTTGLLDATLISGARLPSGPWLWLLVLKLALFSAMLGCAAHNRWRLIPALERGAPNAAARLVASLALELGLGVAIIALVAFLGLLDPHA